MVIALVALLGTGALAMDVGFAWYAKRQVQASADAAALAGAQQLPDVTTAVNTANQYATLNTPDNLSNVAVNVTTRCSVNAGTWCGPTSTYQANTIAVTETAKTPTWFAKILGFDHFDVKGVATACQPCSSAPVDIMVVIDRTGSMCQPQGSGGVCTDLNNAKDGVRTLLGIMDPNIDTVGLVAFPPYDSSGGVCGASTLNTVSVTPTNSSLAVNSSTADAGWYDSTTQNPLTYLDDTLLSDFKTTSSSTTLNPASSIVKHMVDDTYNQRNCIQDFGSTSYADALQAGYNELVKDGRPGVPKVIVFMTDGEANEGSYQDNNGVPLANHGIEPDLDSPTTNFDMSPAGSASTVNPGDAQPCQTAINVAGQIQNSATIYAIGYSLADPNTGAPVYCAHGYWGQVDGSYASSSTDFSHFRCAPIGAALQGPNKNAAWASWPWRADDYKDWPTQGTNTWKGFNPGHFQGGGGGNGSNPCTNSKYGSHLEQPSITSYDTLSQIATPSVAGHKYFYGSAGPSDIQSIFAAIAADITKGTSRLVDDSY